MTDRFEGTALSNFSLNVPDTKGQAGDPLANSPAYLGSTTEPGAPGSGGLAPTSPSVPPTTSSAPPSSSAAPSSKPPAKKADPAPPPKQDNQRSQDSSLAGQVIDIVNKERAGAGCAPLSNESHLADAAQKFSDDMAARNYFSHNTPEGVTFDQRIRNAGYSKPGAENIAKGQRSAAQVMESWMNSDGHRKNILNCELTKIGVGINTSSWVWTQDFGY